MKISLKNKTNFPDAVFEAERFHRRTALRHSLKMCLNLHFDLTFIDQCIAGPLSQNSKHREIQGPSDYITMKLCRIQRPFVT